MRKIAVQLINLYQNFFSYVLKNLLGVSYFCRFRPTCSEYTKEAIKKDGIIIGGYHGLIRLLKCQPLYKTA